MIEQTDWARIARYLARECTPEESAATRRWIDDSPERRALLATVEEIWDRSSSTTRAWDTAAGWTRIAPRLGQPSAAPYRAAVRLPAERSAWRLTIAALSAGAVLLVGAGAGVGYLSRRRVETPPAAPPHEREYHTAAGQHAVINLVDGTRVELGVESSLRVREGSSLHREVFLEGEAAFTVVHDARRPFIVHARDAIAEDIGTRFEVKAYPGDARVRVVVISGEVSVRADDRHGAQLLRAGDDASIESGRVAVARHADTADVVAWTRERFIVRDVPLRDVARQLERWFDVHIAIEDSVAASSRVTINMPASRLTDILGAATAPLGLVYTQTGRGVVIRPPRRSEP